MEKITLDPKLWYQPITKENYVEWREVLKRGLIAKRGFRSDLSGKKLTGGCHLHEGILTRANVPRSLPYFWEIFTEVNSFLLLPEEHIPRPPSRDWCIGYAYDLYGKEAVQEWFYSIPWKTRPPFLLP